MNQTTQNLLAHVVPAQPLRQWVLSLAYTLRAPLAYEPGLIGVVARVFADSLLRWYGRRLAPQGRAPARAPPYHRSVTRLAPTRQQDLFPET